MKKDFYKYNWIAKRQFPHIRKVQDYMLLLETNRDKLPFYIDEWALLNRSLEHDIDKFKPPMADGYVFLEEWYYNEKHKIKNKLSKDEIGKLTYDLHYKTQRHHMEFYKIESKSISPLDICEVACDGLAAGQRNGRSLSESLRFYIDRRNEYLPITEKYDREYVYLVGLVRLLLCENYLRTISTMGD